MVSTTQVQHNYITTFKASSNIEPQSQSTAKTTKYVRNKPLPSSGHTPVKNKNESKMYLEDFGFATIAMNADMRVATERAKLAYAKQLHLTCWQAAMNKLH